MNNREDMAQQACCLAEADMMVMIMMMMIKFRICVVVF